MANNFDGAMPDDQSDTADNGLMDEISQALTSVDDALAYGRKLHGLGGGDDMQTAGLTRMPTVPGNQSESGLPRPLPMPGPLPPTANPFGKRTAGLTRMPASPGNQSESGVPRPLPMPGPLPPTANPFGKRMAGLTRMPTTPGNPSDSGLPRPLPMPGPLPPTSNPFGKRSPYASNSDSGGDEGGAIPDDQETA